MKKLEELLNLPESQEIIEEESKPKRKPRESKANDTLRSIAELDKISEALPPVRGLGKMGDDELDEVSTKSMDAYEDLMDLGMNVESRFSGRIFEVAGQMLKINLDSKVAKMDKKLKMVELQLKKQKLDDDKTVKNSQPIETEGFVISDRNSLIEKLKNIDK